MKLMLRMLVAGLLALPSTAGAQGSVDGKWAGEVQGGRGPQPVTLTLEADGGKPTGSVMGGRGGEVTIQEGTIPGNAHTFKTRQMARGNEIVFSWSGPRKGDEIAFTRSVEGEPFPAQEFVVQRQWPARHPRRAAVARLPLAACRITV